MPDNLQPLPDEHLEARITAWVLGEASPFEAAELKELVEKSPELKLFTNRLRTLHALLPEAEDSSGTGDGDWKLSPGRKFKLTRALGETPEIPRLPVEKRDNRRFARIAAFAIAACALFAAFLLALTRPDFIERKLSRMTTAEPLVADIPSETPEMRELRINNLKKAIREQEDKVEEGRKVLTTISRTKDIVYTDPRFLDGRSQLDVDRGAASSINEFSRIEGEKVQLETQIESLLKYDSEQLLTYASGLDLPDNIIKSLYPQKLELQRQIEGLKASGLADRHPTVQTNQRVLDSMEADLDEGVVNLRTRLQGQLESSKERLSKIELAKNDSKRDALERSIDTQDYVDAKRDFETDQALLEQMKLALVSEEIESNIAAGDRSNPFASKLPSRTRMPVPLESLADANIPAVRPKSPANNSAREIPDPPAAQQPALATNESDFGDGASFGDGWGSGKKKGNTASELEAPDELAAATKEKSTITSGFRRGDLMDRDPMPVEDMANPGQRQLPEAKRDLSLLKEAAPTPAAKPHPPTSSAIPGDSSRAALINEDLKKQDEAVGKFANSAHEVLIDILSDLKPKIEDPAETK